MLVLDHARSKRHQRLRHDRRRESEERARIGPLEQLVAYTLDTEERGDVVGDEAALVFVEQRQSVGRVAGGDPRDEKARRRAERVDRIGEELRRSQSGRSERRPHVVAPTDDLHEADELGKAGERLGTAAEPLRIDRLADRSEERRRRHVQEDGVENGAIGQQLGERRVET